MIDWIITFVIMGMGMVGGQWEKGVRRYGVPCLAMVKEFIEMFNKDKDKKNKAKFLIFGLMIPVLSMGYGVNSFYKKIFKKEWLIRLAYAITLSIPFCAYLALTGASGFKYIVCAGALIGAWQVRAGSLGRIGSFDILIEDIVRYFTVGRLITWIT